MRVDIVSKIKPIVTFLVACMGDTLNNSPLSPLPLSTSLGHVLQN